MIMQNQKKTDRKKGNKKEKKVVNLLTSILSYCFFCTEASTEAQMSETKKVQPRRIGLERASC